MKIDPTSWKEVPCNEENEATQGRLRLRVSRPAAFFVTVEGVETLAAYGTEIDLETQGEMTFRVEADKQARAFMHAPYNPTHQPEGETFTNVDRQPMESGSVLAVKKAAREFALEQRRMMREIHQARDELRQVKATAAAKPEKEAAAAQEETGKTE